MLSVDDVVNKINQPSYQRGMELLQKVFGNIINDPNNTKYHNLNLKQIYKRLGNCKSLIQLLTDCGFTKSDNGKRLLFDITKLDSLKLVHHKLFKMESAVNQIVSMGFDEDITRSALELTDCNVAEAIHCLIYHSVHLNVDTKRRQVLQRLVLQFGKTTLEYDNKHSVHLLRADAIYKDKQCESTVAECDSVLRIREVLSRYQSFISNKEQGTDGTDDGIFQFIFGELFGYYDNTDLLNDFNHSLQAHSHEFEEIYNVLLGAMSDNIPCDLGQCLLIRRNQRDRMKCIQNTEVLKDLYFSDDDATIVLQELLDRIHCYYCHSFDVGHRMTRNEKEDITNQEMKTDENEIDRLLFDGVVSGIYKLNGAKLQKYRNVPGLERIYNGNNKFTTTDHKPSILNEDEKETNTDNEYKYGFRFFYWPYYKNNEMADDDARGLSMTQDTSKHAANIGYKVHHFYMDKKYTDLKQEILMNEICTLDVVTWRRLTRKAEHHINTLKYRTFSCVRVKSAGNYDLRNGDLLARNHLIAMMVYCNYDELQRKFSKTYRRNQQNETIEDIKKKHRNYWHLGRLLRETVECFGMEHKNEAVTVYHGAKGQFAFESLFAFIKSPFSTTRDYAVALNFAAAGIVLQLKIDTKSWTYKVDEGFDAFTRISCFDCSLISDFVNEREIFCIGGLNKFHFTSIIDANVAINYEHYIKGLKQMTTGMTHGGLAGDTFDLDMPESKEEEQMVYRLLAHQIWRCLPKHRHAHEFESCPPYIATLMDSHCRHVRTIHLAEQKHKILDLVFRFDNGWIKLDELLSIFPNTQLIQWYGHNKDISFLASPAIYKNILAFIRNNLDRKYPRFDGFVIQIDPKFEKEINEVVATYSYAFAQIGWTMGCFVTDPFQAWSGNNPMIMKYIKMAKTNPMIKQVGNEYIQKFGINQIIAVWSKGAQKKDFDIFEDYDKLRTFVISISRRDSKQ